LKIRSASPAGAAVLRRSLFALACAISFGPLVSSALISTAEGAVAASSADPRNLDGVWWTIGYDRTFRTLDKQLPPFTARGRAEWEHNIQAEKEGRPVADAPTQCLPHGVPRVMASPYPIQIITIPGQVTIVHEVAHNQRLIYMDEPQPAHLDPTFMGHSVGRWDGDTLVVDTIGLNDRTRVDEEGITHSDRLHVVERFRKIDGGRLLEDLITIEDPVMFTAPWTARRTYAWRPDQRLMEYVCEENNRNVVENGVTVAR
jgi:hypothetical protein